MYVAQPSEKRELLQRHTHIGAPSCNRMVANQVRPPQAARSHRRHSRRLEQLVHLRHHLERIGHVHHIGLAARPSAIRIERNCPPLADKPPAHHVRLLAMAAGREPLGMPRRRARLSDLVQMRQKGKHGLPVAALVNQRFRTAQRRAALAKSPESARPLRSHVLCPSGCFLVQPAPATNSSFASGRIVCSSCFGARNPVTVVRIAGSSTATCSTVVSPFAQRTPHAFLHPAAETTAAPPA